MSSEFCLWPRNCLWNGYWISFCWIPSHFRKEAKGHEREFCSLICLKKGSRRKSRKEGKSNEINGSMVCLATRLSWSQPPKHDTAKTIKTYQHIFLNIYTINIEFHNACGLPTWQNSGQCFGCIWMVGVWRVFHVRVQWFKQVTAKYKRIQKNKWLSNRKLG